jgi:hypothetical protein
VGVFINLLLAGLVKHVYSFRKSACFWSTTGFVLVISAGFTYHFAQNLI